FLDTFMYAFPHTFRDVQAETGTIVSLKVSTDIGGQWSIVKMGNGWELNKNTDLNPRTQVTIDPDTAWKLFSKSWRPEQVSGKVEIEGDRLLGEQALKMVAVMA
ncbi:MAG TPA: hypothetical protein VHN59_14140, partial [Chitinophagaceae bacterium]|nr:hypothetical protein [Chitinophagaceae bacterium]